MKQFYFLLSFLWIVLSIHSNPTWKQISGSDVSTHDFFVENPTARVIWGYEDGLWRVACQETCHDILQKYRPLQRMSNNTGYWISFDSNIAATQVSAELVGEWLITRKSSDRWDNTTASLSISTQSSNNLTGHPFALLAMGLEDPMPISDFSLIGIQVIEDAILQLDYTLYGSQIDAIWRVPEVGENLSSSTRNIHSRTFQGFRKGATSDIFGTFNCYISTSDPSMRTGLKGTHRYLYTFIDQAGYTEAIYSKVSYGRWMFLANKGFDFQVKTEHMNSISDEIFVDCKDTNHDTNVSRSKRVYLNITKKDEKISS